MEIRPELDNEPLVEKVKRLSKAHNIFVANVQNFMGSIKLVVDTVVRVLEDEIDDFDKKFNKANLAVRIEATVHAKLKAHAVGDLEMYARFGKNLDALKAEAKKEGLQSFYNKVMRKLNKIIEENKFGEPKADFSHEELQDMPDMKTRQPPATEEP